MQTTWNLEGATAAGAFGRRQSRSGVQPAIDAEELAYRRDIAAHARAIVSSLHEGGGGFVPYEDRKSPNGDRYYFNDVGDAVVRLARREGLGVRWFGCDDIGMRAVAAP